MLEPEDGGNLEDGRWEVTTIDSEDLKGLGKHIGELVASKNEAYGNSFGTAGEALRLLYPEGLKPDQYDDALALVRIWDKMKRIATHKDAFGESPFVDIAGYGILGAALSAMKLRDSMKIGEEAAVEEALRKLPTPKGYGKRDMDRDMETSGRPRRHKDRDRG